MQIKTLKSQKTSDGFGNLYVGDWEKGGKIRAGTLHLVSHYFQESDWGSAELKKWGQCNEPGFCPLIRLQDLKDQH